MSALRDAPGLSGPPDFHDCSEAIAQRIAGMSYAELRDACDTYRLRCQMRGHRPYGYRFGEWLRDRVASEVCA